MGGAHRGASLKGVGSGRTGAAHRLGRGRARWRARHICPQDLGVHPVPKDGLWPEPGPAYPNLGLRTYTSYLPMCTHIYVVSINLSTSTYTCVCVCVCVRARARACVWACLLCMCVNAYGRAHADTCVHKSLLIHACTGRHCRNGRLRRPPTATARTGTDRARRARCRQQVRARTRPRPDMAGNSAGVDCGRETGVIARAAAVGS